MRIGAQQAGEVACVACFSQQACAHFVTTSMLLTCIHSSLAGICCCRCLLLSIVLLQHLVPNGPEGGYPKPHTRRYKRCCLYQQSPVKSLLLTRSVVEMSGIELAPFCPRVIWMQSVTQYCPVTPQPPGIHLRTARAGSPADPWVLDPERGHRPAGQHPVTAVEHEAGSRESKVPHRPATGQQQERGHEQHD